MTQQSKFFQMPAAVPWPSLQQAKFSTAVGDVDGDGRQEIVALNFSQNSVFFATISYLNPGELTPFWNTGASGWGELVVMDTRIGSLGEWNFSGSDVFVMADLDNDGAAEIFVFDQSAWVAVFKWKLTGFGAVQTWAASLEYIQNASISGPAGTWNISPGDRFFSADVDGDGQQEIVVFDGQTWLGVLKLQSSSLSLIALIDSKIPSASGGQVWMIQPGDRFSAAIIGGVQRIIIYDGNDWFCVLQWSASSLQVLWIVNGTFSGSPGVQWKMGPGDQLLATDVDGDGDQEIFIFDGNSYVGVLKWQSSAMQTIWLTNQTFTASVPGWWWTVEPNDRFYVLPSVGGDRVAAYDGTQKLGTFMWKNEALQLTTFINTEADGANNLKWMIKPGDQFFTADLDGDGDAEIIAFDGSASLCVLRYGIVPASVANQVPAWNLSFILGSSSTTGSPPAPPPVPIAAFTGDQLSVYQYMSNQVYSDSSGDIRGEYTNLNIPDGNFQSYSAQIADMTNPSGQNFSAADWTAVQAILVPELQNVGPLRGLFGNMNDLALAIQSQQDSDLTTAVQNVDANIVSNDDTVSFWFGQFVDAAIWGAAVFPEAKLGQMALAVTASLFGSYLGSSGPPQQVAYSQFKNLVDNTYLNARNQNGSNETAALSDAGMIAVAGQLAGEAWAWQPSESAAIAQSTTNANRLAFYQILIPVRFQIIQFLENPMNYPYGDAQRNAPWSYWSQANSDGTFNVYMLGYPDDYLTPYGYASQELMNDLFQNLGVSQQAFFLGQGVWSAIPQVSSQQNDAATPPEARKL